MMVEDSDMGGEQGDLSREAAASLLGWWLDSGVDAPIQEAPRNWLAKEPTPSAAPPTMAAPAAVREMPATLDLFRDWLGSAADVPLAADGVKRVLPHGVEGASVMLIADAPSNEDAADERPIGGAAWALTERMLGAIGIDADQTYLASLSCFRALGRTMTAEQMAACALVARRHVALVKPKRLLLLGDGPAQALLGKPVAEARGHAHNIEGVRTVATFHPRFLIRRASDKALAWRDLLLLMEDEA